MPELTVTTTCHTHDLGSEYLDHWTAEVRGPLGRYGAGKGRLQSQAVREAVKSYFKVREVEGPSDA